MKVSLASDGLSKVSPLRLAFFIMLGTVASIIVVGMYSADQEIEWVIAIAGLLLFAWLTAVFGFFNPNWGKHALLSLLYYFILMGIHLGVAHLISTTQFFEMREYQLLLAAITLFFLVAIVMSKAIKSMTEFFSKH